MHNDVVRFTNSVNSIQDAIEEHGLYNIQEQLEANVVALFQQIAQTTVDLGIQIDFTEMVNPSWMTDTSPLSKGVRSTASQEGIAEEQVTETEG